MSIRQAPTGNFDSDLTQLLPRLRVYALSLTRDSVRADDLVQQTVVRSLAGHSLVGADVVEVSPPYDGPGQITALLAANLAFELVSVFALGR